MGVLVHGGSMVGVLVENDVEEYGGSIGGKRY